MKRRRRNILCTEQTNNAYRNDKTKEEEQELSN